MCCNNSSDENQRRLASGSTIRLPCGTICTLSIDRSSAKTHHVVGSMLMRPQLCQRSPLGFASRGRCRPLRAEERGQGPMPGPGIPRPPPSVPDFPPGTPKPPPRTVPDTPPGVPTPPDVAPPDPGVPDPPPAVPGVPEPPPTAPPISPPHVREEMPAVPPLAEQYRRIAQGLTAGAGAGEVDGPDESDPTREPPKAQGPGQEEPGKQKERTVGHEEPGQEGRAVAPEDEVGEALVERAACVADAMAAAEGSSLSSTEASTETEAVPGWMRAMEVPEVVVGRVAMAGWAALLVSELLEHRTAPQLLMDRPVAAAWVTWGVAAASCLPGAWRVRRRCGGTFSAAAETANGRLAMLAFALVAVTEALRGRPTFG